MKLAILLSVTTVLVATAASRERVLQLPRTPVDVSKLAPQVGDPVPDFTLKDQHGKIWTLREVMGPKGAMLVFYRSADW
jgi:hypothetical protein